MRTLCRASFRRILARVAVSGSPVVSPGFGIPAQSLFLNDDPSAGKSDARPSDHSCGTFRGGGALYICERPQIKHLDSVSAIVLGGIESAVGSIDELVRA
jgi:hypothetical protein